MIAEQRQLQLFADVVSEVIVNVASVPQRSPFRYPGGKTWLVPYIRRWFRQMRMVPALLVEPFAGGGIISLTVAAEDLAKHVTMVELDQNIAAVWETILYGDGAALAEQITGFTLTHESAQEVLSQTPTSMQERAFATILKNRVNRGGILAAGASMIKYGENGKGVLSRWYPETLSRRILDIVAIRDRIDFISGDGMAIMRKHAPELNAVYFMDPPYTAAGKKAGSRLYTHSVLDHEELFRVTQQLQGDFLMTYDNTDEVRALAREHGFDTVLIPMKNTHHAEMYELVISRNLDWARA